MSPPVYSVGQVWGAADVNSWALPMAVVKPGNTTRNTLTLAIDPDLQLSLAASATYDVRCGIQYNCASGAFGWTWTVPSGASGSEQFFGIIGALSSNASAWATTNSATSSTTGALLITGTLVTSTTPGTFGIQWASSTGPASLIVNINSYLTVQRIS